MDRREFILAGVGLTALAAGGAAWRYPWEAIGQLPAGADLDRIQASPHYYDGAFHSLTDVPLMTGQESSFEALGKMIWNTFPDLKPAQPVPHVKTDFGGLPAADCLVWLGHSSFFLQLHGRRILIDPVLSSYASPVSFINRAFAGTDIYRPEELPDIDLVALTHDHWDHLDYATLMALKDRIKAFACPLGVGAHLEKWGFAKERIHEADWWEEIALSEDLRIHILPSQHFSGRTLTRNQTEWCGFAFLTPERRIYCSGDGGYGVHFAEIGRRLGHFDFALLEDGQYNENWAKIHMFPEETAQAAVDVRAAYVIPAHGGKFALARHPWTEPYERLLAASAGQPYALLTPQMGACVLLDRPYVGTAWWRTI